ncbi:NUMOD4 domain-containing protein [Enterobacter hormaechei]
MEEVWKSIPEFEGYYEASSLGRIRSLDVIQTSPKGVKWVKKVKYLNLV